MLKPIKRLFNNDEGQALVIVAIGLVALLGFGAIAVDYGYLAWQRRSLQNAADSAALAAAWELPSDSLVGTRAREYAIKNASELTNDQIHHEILENDKQVQVDVNHTYKTFLGGVLGKDTAEISASATAEKYNVWSGAALPFLNTEDYSGEFGIWGPETSSGFFARMWKDSYEEREQNGQTYFDIDYKNGISIQNGMNASIKGAMEEIYNQNPGGIVYIWSIKSSVIEEGQVRLVDSNGNLKPDKKNIDKLGQKDILYLGDLVLLEVTFDNYEFSGGNGHSLSVEYQREYDIFNGEFPEDYDGPGDISSRLIK